MTSGAHVNALDRSGATPLHAAVRAGMPREARALLEAGADPSAPDAEGRLAADALVGRDSTAARLRADLANFAAIRADFLKRAAAKSAAKTAAKADEKVDAKAGDKADEKADEKVSEKMDATVDATAAATTTVGNDDPLKRYAGWDRPSAAEKVEL